MVREVISLFSLFVSGYDPGQVNSYLHKIIHNAGAMEYDVAVTEDHSFYRILGLRSLHGEFLQFTKVIPIFSMEISCELNFFGSLLQYMKMGINSVISNAGMTRNIY